MDGIIIGKKNYVKTQKSYAQIECERVHKLNVQTRESQAFKDACMKAGVDTTKRQARKFRLKKGKAYKQGRK